VIRRLYRLPAAEADIDDIYLHIALDNVAAADRVVLRILSAEQRLLVFPEIGQARPDLLPGLRHWPVGNYLIFYRITDETLEIVRVVHGARDLPVLFRP
jgi:toxin ParE1/3/4